MKIQSKLQHIIESCFAEHGFAINVSGYTIEYDCSNKEYECIRHYFYLTTSDEIPLEFYPTVASESTEIAEEYGLFKDTTTPQFIHIS